MPAEHLHLSLSRIPSLHIFVVGHCPMSVQTILTSYFIPRTCHNCLLFFRTAFIVENHLLVCFSKDNFSYLLLPRCPRLQRITHLRILISLHTLSISALSHPVASLFSSMSSSVNLALRPSNAPSPHMRQTNLFSIG